MSLHIFLGVQLDELVGGRIEERRLRTDVDARCICKLIK
jgi:hypothetical protein